MTQKIFVTTKTYPTRSSKYKELVCTAGITEAGEWIRIYPIPFRSLEEYKKFKKYTWIEAEVQADKSDPRPESHKINTTSIEILEHVDTGNCWADRKQMILQKTRIYTNLNEIIDKANTTNELSLCTFKPTKYLGLEATPRKIEKLSDQQKIAFKNANRSLFQDESCETEFTLMPDIPYNFKIKFEDDSGKVSSMSILDWEISQLYLKYPKIKGVQKVEEKVTSLFEKDLYLFLGTMRQMHGWTKNPFTIIGLFYPPSSKYYQQRFEF